MGRGMMRGAGGEGEMGKRGVGGRWMGRNQHLQRGDEQ